MSKQSSKVNQGKPSNRIQSAILRHKRKAEQDKLDAEQESKRRGYQNEKESSSSQSEDPSPPYCTSMPEPSQGYCIPLAPVTASGTVSQFRGLTCLPTPESCTRMESPLPFFDWADSREVWKYMVRKDKLYPRDPEMLSRHPAIQARMRAILLDWLIEVCEVYRLHRETYYLAQDFIDRYLATQTDVPKQQLQLLGITTLFIAAKIEEIYPPQLKDFSYVTDGACTDDEILDKELVVLKALNWDLSPMTVNGWLNLYLQLATISQKEDEDNILITDFSSHAFVQIAQLIDLCMMDIGCLKFPYSVIAASALFHALPDEISLSVTGYKWSDIQECVQWMCPFAVTLQEEGQAELQHFQQIPSDEQHNIQIHNVDLNLLEKAQSRQLLGDCSICPSTLVLTPPSSDKKMSKLLCSS